MSRPGVWNIAGSAVEETAKSVEEKELDKPAKTFWARGCQ